MKDFKAVGREGYCGMLVFVRIVKNILWDENLDTETYEYENKMKAGFILEISDYFDEYYLVRFFDGDKQHFWGVDIFYKIEENALTYLQK